MGCLVHLALSSPQRHRDSRLLRVCPLGFRLPMHAMLTSKCSLAERALSVKRPFCASAASKLGLVHTLGYAALRDSSAVHGPVQAKFMRGRYGLPPTTLLSFVTDSAMLSFRSFARSWRWPRDQAPFQSDRTWICHAPCVHVTSQTPCRAHTGCLGRFRTS